MLFFTKLEIIFISASFNSLLLNFNDVNFESVFKSNTEVLNKEGIWK